MLITLDRRWPKSLYTIGRLSIDGVYLCNTLEDPVTDKNKNGVFDGAEVKDPGSSAIPYGLYDVELTWSPKFKRKLPLLINVPHFDGIRIHRGTTAKDTHGCIIPGINEYPGVVTHSAIYEQKIIKMMAAAIASGETVKINII